MAIINWRQVTTAALGGIVAGLFVYYVTRQLEAQQRRKSA